MHSATSVDEVDLKSSEPCGHCILALRERQRSPAIVDIRGDRREIGPEAVEIPTEGFVVIAGVENHWRRLW